MTFARRFAAVLFAVAVVAAFGVAWEHSGAARWITPPGPPGGAVERAVRPAAAPPSLPAGTVVSGNGRFRVFRTDEVGGGIDLSDTQNLVRTAEIEGAVIAGVVACGIVSQRRRRARRAALIAGSGRAPGPPAPS